MGDLSALQAAIKLIVDAGNDTAQAIQPGESLVARLLAYKNIVGDLVALLPTISEIPTEISQLSPTDYLTLVQSVVTDLAVTDAKAQAIIAASLKVLGDLVLVLLPDVTSLVSAIKS